jgi:type IV secretion system protein VirB4
MFAILDKAARTNEDRQEAAVEEFIPLACHYDPTTLITKNGELLQTIKITGFSFESVNADDGDKKTLRHVIRDAVQASIKTNDFALWIHTVRRKKDLSGGGKYTPGSFEDHVHRSWCKRHDWEHKYVNELYITVICEGQNFNLGVKEFTRSLFFLAERKYRLKYLEEAHKRLDDAVSGIVNMLKGFGARRLGVIEYQNVSYSEPLQFFGKIINLYEKPTPLPVMDISTYLPTHEVSFGFNVLEVRGETGRHFGTVLTVKEYHEVSSSAIDNFLQLDEEFIVTETFDFINSEKALKKFEHQQYLIKLSGDNEFSDISGMTDIMQSNRGRSVDFGEHQISIMLLNDSLPDLERQVKQTFDAFRRVGIVAVREDVMMEEIFWTQLPGNFEFLRRLSPINTRRIGGFASLYNFPAGKLDNNHWGPAATVFYTRAGTPYFFSFHVGNNGHTMIVGPFGAGKTVLLNFLVCEARKFNNRLFFFDQERASELFIRAVGGNYRRLMKNPASNMLRMNPLQLPDTPQNRSFLRALLQYMVMDERLQVSEQDKQLAEQAIEHVYLLPQAERRLSNVIPKFWPQTELPKASAAANADPFAALSGATASVQEVSWQRMARWYGQGEHAHIMDSPHDELVLNQMVYGFGMTEVVKDRRVLIPIFSYLIHRIRQTLDGTPTMIVLDEAWSLVDNPVFASFIPAWLDELKANNAVVIFATESVDNIKESSITQPITQKMATQIYLPNQRATDAYRTVFGLNNVEFELLNSMSSSRREFLLKHYQEAVVANLDLSGMHDIIAVLSGNKESIALMENIMLDVGDDASKWLPLFRERASKKQKG